MKKKKIVFSSSGGTPAMQLLIHFVDNFGKYDIERIAAEIAAMCLRLLDDTVAFDADNVSGEENVLVIS